MRKSRSPQHPHVARLRTTLPFAARQVKNPKTMKALVVLSLEMGRRAAISNSVERENASLNYWHFH
jgi:hypothetical protein